MNKKLIISLLPVLTLASCGTSPALSSALSEASKQEAASIIKNMRKTAYRVTWNGVRTKTYPQEYSAYNTTENLSKIRDYGFDSEGARSSRNVTDTSMTTVFEETDGRIYNEVILPNNTVKKEYVTNYTLPMKFGNYYGSAFDYIFESDLKDGKIDPEKAYFLFNKVTGISHPVSGATYSVNSDNLISKIDFQFATLPVGITTETSIETAYFNMIGSFTFDYDISAFTHLAPYTEKSEKYEEAIAKIGNNYTLTTTSNAISNPIVTYVTENAVYLHMDANKGYPVENDWVYIKNRSTYKSYFYDGKEWTRDESIDIATILPHYNEISPYVVEEKSPTHLAIKKDAARYAAELLLIGYTTVTSGTGLKADMYLENGYLSKVNATFSYYAANIVINNTYDNYETTAIPSWLEMPA